AARGTRQEVAQAGEEGLGVLLGGTLPAARPPPRLLECGARLGAHLGRVGGGGQVLDRLRRVAELEEGEAAAVEAVGVDLGYLVHEQELREALDRLLEERPLLRRVAGELRAVVAHPGEVVGGDQRHDLGLAEARAPEELLQVAVALDHLVAHAVEAPLEAALEARQVGLEPGPGGGRALASDASSLGTGRSLTNTSCVGVMVTSTPFGCSSFSAALGRSTSATGFTMAEVVIMKMMSRTRNTSVRGVTLISATMRPRVCPLNSAMAPPRRRDRLDQPRAADAERPVDALHAVLEVVVEDERDDADGEAERGGDERLGDAARHHAEAARADD